MTAAERLLQLAGATGTAGALLLMIGTGATTGAALTDYSGLSSATAAEHLLAEPVSPVAPVLLGRRPKINRTKENDEALLLALGML